MTEPLLNGETAHAGEETSSAETTKDAQTTKDTQTVKDAETAKDAETTKDVIEPGMECNVKSLEERFNSKGEVELIECGEHQKGFKGQFDNYAIVTKRIFNKDSTIRTIATNVNSPHILRILRDVVGTYATQPAGFDVPIKEEAPFALFYHHRKELSLYEPPDDITRQHQQLLLRWMDVEMGQIIADSEKLIQKGYITFPLLWTIFKPGELQFMSDQGHARLFKLETATYKEIANKGPLFEIRCSYVDYNGTGVGRAKEIVQLYDRLHLTGNSPTKMTTLPIFPRKLINDDALEEKLRARGLRLLELTGIRVMQYNGLLEFLKLPPYSWWGPACERDGVWTPISITGRVVVDKKTFAEDFLTQTESVEEVDSKSDTEAQNVYLQSSAMAMDEKNSIDPVLCPPYTIGYALDRKVWCRLFIDSIQEIQWRPDPMDELILPSTPKRILRALVGSHKFPEHARDEWDLKGKGLVILLHGTPGTGKTLTAETAAEYTKRALLKVSLSELSDQERLEENMLTFQRYASTWKAVMLIDEADVFLEARTTGSNESSINRNGLVAVFLRTLEYFQGIIFLTSNRVAVFDDAIRSRVHLALQYESPDFTSRRQMWLNQLRFLPPDSCSSRLRPRKDAAPGDVPGDALDRLAKAEMNGREISNSIHTALTLARDEKEVLGMEHLETIIRLWVDFEGQMHPTNGVPMAVEKL